MAEQDGENSGRGLFASVTWQVALLVGIAIILIILIVIGKDVVDLSNNRFGAYLLCIGIGSFFLSLIIMSLFTYFSIPANEAERRKKSLLKLDRKEIRRSIALSFTILYILMISFYFCELESANHTTSVVNSFVDETVLHVTDNSSSTTTSSTTTTSLNKTTNLTDNGLTGEGLTHLSEIIATFTTVYIVIIGFYFGSRVYEKIKETKDAEETLKIRYVLDEIDETDFNTKMGVLKGMPPNAPPEQTSDEKKITVEIDIIRKDDKE